MFLLNPKNEKLVQKKLKENEENYVYKTCHNNKLLETAKTQTVSHNQSFISFIPCYHVSVKVTSHH
jgi:hypothetical protein